MELSSNENEDENFTSSFIRFDHPRPPSNTPGDTPSSTPDTCDSSTREIPETPQWDSVTESDGENDTSRR
jgi:hypothetical protein